MAITSASAHQPRGEDRPVATMHCRHHGLRDREQTDAPNGGQARGYLGRWRASQQSRYDQVDDRLHRIFIHRHPWGDCPHLPLVVRLLSLCKG